MIFLDSSKVKIEDWMRSKEQREGPWFPLFNLSSLYIIVKTKSMHFTTSFMKEFLEMEPIIKQITLKVNLKTSQNSLKFFKKGNE